MTSKATEYFKKIPPRKRWQKVRGFLTGLALIAVGYMLLENEMGPVLMGSVFVAVGGALCSLDLLRGLIPVGLDVVSFGVYCIERVRGAFKNNG